IELALRGADGNTTAIGAQVTLEFGGSRQTQVVDGGGGFCSQNQRTLHFGLGRDAVMSKATIRWPSGRRQVVENLHPDRIHTIREAGA
ncbi:MAG TPA: ASPIC/UnbV domain-containing protein, partial [Planctomycetota bacterium]|nr:ASPIC/UnbV domain-containing protein [Planctomycetota bacterium]